MPARDWDVLKRNILTLDAFSSIQASSSSSPIGLEEALRNAAGQIVSPDQLVKESGALDADNAALEQKKLNQPAGSSPLGKKLGFSVEADDKASSPADKSAISGVVKTFESLQQRFTRTGGVKSYSKLQEDLISQVKKGNAVVSISMIKLQDRK